MNLIAAALMAPTTGQGGGGMGFLLVQIGLIFAVFYFLILRPQSAARKKHAELLAGLKKGDEVVTAGGLMGRVKELKDDRVTIETGTATVVVQRQRIVHIQCLAHVKRLACRDADQRSEIPHPQLNLLNKSTFADSRRRLIRLRAVELRSVGPDRAHLVVYKIRHVHHERRHNASRE